MHALRHNGWLILGAAAAVLVAWLDLGSAVTRALAAAVPLPWGSLGIGFLVFAAFAALHFRLQLVRALEHERDYLERSAAASRLIQAASADGRRWLGVVQENLHLVGSDSTAERERVLYLGGAVANADKVEQAFDRIEGNQQRLDEIADEA